MAEVYCIVNKTIMLSTPTQKTQQQQPLAYDNALAHAMRVTVVNEDGPESLSGISVVASFMKADGNTVTPINGTVGGDNLNVAEVILPASCYVTPGRFKLTMNLVKNGAARTVLWVEGHVEKNIGGTIIDPGTEVDNIPTVIAEARQAAEDAAEAAENASAYTDAIAPEFSDLMATSPFVPFSAYNQHCWYDGDLYVNTEDIDAAESWNSSHWEVCDISGELSWCLKRGTNGDVATLAEAKEYLNIT